MGIDTEPLVNTELSDFGAAFDELAAELTSPGEKKVEPAPAPVAAEATPVPVVPASAPEGTPPGEAPVAASPTAEVPAPAIDYAAEVARLNSELEEARKAPPAPAPAPAAAVEPPVYSADESAAITKYKEDWADVARGEELIRRKEYKELVGYIFDQVKQYTAPMADFVETRSGKDQYTDIVGLVPDYDAVRDSAIAWVNTQPEYLKKAYTDVVANGTAKDVADLITRFKKETNYAAPVKAGATTVAVPIPAPVAGMPAADPKKAAAAAGLKLVAGKRSEQSDGPDPNDFAAGFAEFATATN